MGIFKALICLALLGAALHAPHGLAQIHKWTDADGKTHYGNKPPPKAKSEEVVVRVQSFGGAPKLDYSWLTKKRPVESKNQPVVTLYSAVWCGQCKVARRSLQKQGIQFREVDIDDGSTAAEDFKKSGPRGVPVIVAGNRMMTGFSEGSFKRLMLDASK